MKQKKIHYQSDWAEAGFHSPLNSRAPGSEGNRSVHEREIDGAQFRWVVHENSFESEFYGIPVLELRMEVSDPGLVFLDDGLDNPGLGEQVRTETALFLEGHAWESSYLYSRIIKNEPLYNALLELGFKEVEQRSLYGCRFGELEIGRSGTPPGNDVHFSTLADLSEDQSQSAQKQIISICREAFDQGFSRHFRDEFLSGIRPGVEYILLAMELNFRKLDPGHILIASSIDGQVCGFSAVGTKSGFDGDVYTQLLSAVSSPWRGRGIYRSLTSLLARIFPGNAELLNVTHTRNRSIRKAYAASGRKHIADTVILRRVFKD